jgi:hypothetical protein
MATELNVTVKGAKTAKQALQDVADATKPIKEAMDSASEAADQAMQSVSDGARSAGDAAEAAGEATAAGMQQAANSTLPVREALDATGEAAETLADRNKKAADEWKKDTEKALEPLRELERQVHQIGAEINALDGGAKTAAVSVESVASPGKTIKFAAMFTAINQGVEILGKIRRAAGAVRETISDLAANGSEAFVELDGALNSFADSWEDLKSNLADSESGQRVAGWLKDAAEFAGDAATNFDNLNDASTKVANEWLASAADMVGWTSRAQQAREEAEALTVAMDQQAEAILENRKARQSNQADKLVADIERQREREREKAALAEVQSIEEIDKRLQDEIAHTKELAKQGSLTFSELKAAREKLNDLERRRNAIEKEGASARKKAAEDENKARDDAERDRKKAAEEDEQAIARQKALDDAKKQAAAPPAPQQGQQPQVPGQGPFPGQQGMNLQQVQAMFQNQPAGGNVPDPVQQMVDAAQDVKAVAKVLSQQPAQDAYVNTLEFGGSEDDALAVAKDARRKAFRQARSQLQNGGPEVFSQDQIANAVQQNLDGQLSALQANGQMGWSAVNAIGQLANAQLQAEQQAQQQQQQINQIMQAFNGGRKRRQNGGNL